MRSLLLPVLLLLNGVAQAATTHDDLLVHFAKDRSELAAEAIAEIDDFLTRCTLNGEYRFTVHGHTDSDGSARYNDALSSARALAVQRYLLARGVAVESVQVERSGETQPLESNTAEDGMAVNRRVRITFERTYYVNTDELRNTLTAGTVQHFEIDASQPATVTGSAGTRIDFEANSFVDAKGRRVSGPVTVELTEALGHQAMIGHRLSTRSGGQILETGGMMRVTATSSAGDLLQLAPTSPMQVVLPNDAAQQGMQLFLSTDGSDWSTTSQPMQVKQVRQWIEPRRPYIPDRHFKAPLYREDKKGMPVKPSPPFLKAPPVLPDRADFKPRRSFFSFIWPERGQKETEARYQIALRAYEKRMEEHVRKQMAFDEEVRTYPERMERYQQRKVAWDTQKAQEHTRWIDEVYLPAHARHYASNADRRQLRDSLMTSWRSERDAKFSAYMAESDESGTADMNGMRAYFFTATQLGWINCDRFYDVAPREQHYVVARGSAPDRTEAFLIFTEMACMLQLDKRDDGSWRSEKVSKSEPAVLFAYAVVDGRPHVCHEPVVPGRKVEFNFKPSSYAEIAMLLQRFGQRAS